MQRKYYLILILILITNYLIAQDITLKTPRLYKLIEGWSATAPTIYWDKIEEAAYYEYSINEKVDFKNIGQVSEFTPPVTTTGIHTFYLRAVDKNNKRSKVAQIKFGIDTIPPHPPKITKVFPSKWTNQKKIKVYWEASLKDVGSGKDYHLAIIDDKKVIKDIPRNILEVEFETDGIHKIRISCSDKVGNTSYSEAFVYIDSTPPVAPPAIKIYPSAVTNNQQPVITFEESKDELSGISHYEYTLDEKNWIETKTNKIKLEEKFETGNYKIGVRAVDNATNKSEVVYANFTIDTIPPEKVSNLKVEEDDKGEVIVTFDKGKDGAYFEGSYIENKIERVTSPWRLKDLQRGKSYKIKVWATDEAGNKGEAAEIVYKVPLLKRVKKIGKLPTLDFKGSRLTHIYRNVSISPDIGRTVGGYSRGTSMDQNMVICVQGKVENTTVDVQIQDFEFQDSKTFIELKGGKTAAKLGNFSTGVSAGEFLSYTKQIEGVEVKTKHKPFEAKVIYSQGTSFTREEIIRGDNRKGPYKLSAMFIVENSEVVEIKKGEKAGAGWERAYRDKDYIIDYFLAELTFTEIISDKDEIKVSYEYSFVDIFFRSGDVIGLEGKVNLPKESHLQFGVLHETTKAGGGGEITYKATDPTIPLHERDTTDEEVLRREYPLINWPIVARTEDVKVKVSGKPDVVAVRKEKFRSDPTRYAKNYVYEIDDKRGTISFVKPHSPGEHLYPPGYPDENTEEGIVVSYNYRTAFTYESEKIEVLLPAVTEYEIIKGLPTDFWKLPLQRAYDTTRVWAFTDKKEKILLSRGGENDIDNLREYELLMHERKIRLFPQVGKLKTTNIKHIVIEYRELPAEAREERPDELTKNTIGGTLKLNLLPRLPLTINFAQSYCETLERFGWEAYDELPRSNEEFDGVTATFTLTHKPIKPGSETVIKISKGIERILKRDSEYYIDYNAGRITFTEKYIPQKEEKIKITYKYFKEAKDITGIEFKKITGNAVKINTAFNFKDINLTAAYRRVEPTYLPVGTGRPQAEIQNIQTGLNYPITPYLTLNTNFHTIKIPEVKEIYKKTGKVTTSLTTSGGIAFTQNNLPTLKYDYSQQRNKDNLPQGAAGKTDTENISHSLSMSHKIDKITSSVTLRRSDSKNLVALQELKDNFYHFKLSYIPSRRFILNTDYQTKKTETIKKEAPTVTSKTRATAIDMISFPTDIIRLNCKYDIHHLSDPRRPKGKIHKIDAGINISPIDIYPFTSFNTSYSSTTNPTEIPHRKERSHRTTLPLSLTEEISLTPTYHYSKYETISKSKSINKGYTFHTNYTPLWGKGINLKLSLNYNTQKNKTYQSGQPTTLRKGNTYGIDISLQPIKRVNLNLHFDNREDKQYREGKRISKIITSNPHITLTYNLGKRIDANYKYLRNTQKTRTTTSTKTLTNQHTLGVRINLGKNASSTLDVNRTTAQDHTSTMITAKVDIALQ